MGLDKIFQNQKSGKREAHQQTASGSYGMAASASAEATKAGEQVLRDGGNAADALIAMQFALTSTEGINTGIGASGFLTYYDSEQSETKVMNGHSKAPAAVTSDLFLDEDRNVIPFDERSTSPQAIGVPGIMKLMETAHKRYGTMPLDRLIDPAIKLAEKGYRVNALWERTIEQFRYRMGEEARKVFMPNGNPLKEGDTVKQPDLANALKIIRDKGFESVYEGEIADAIVAAVQDLGGQMTKKDLLDYQVIVEEPLWSGYREFNFAFPVPPDGGGFAVAQLLKLLEPFNIDQYDPRAWEKYFLLAEAMRLTQSDLAAYIGDPDFVSIPLEGLLHPDYLEERQSLINFKYRSERMEFGDPWKYQDGKPNRLIRQESAEQGMETTHFTAVDCWGNVAACTSSIERMFGTGIMVPGYGFLLNNDLTDFSPKPGGANEPDGSKRPVSSKSPTIGFHDGKPFFTLGSPGGFTIIASVLQVLLNVVDHKMDLKEAIAEPRIYISADLSVQWEDGIAEAAKEKLNSIGYKVDTGYKVKTSDSRIGDVQAILINPSTGYMYGAADSPRPGMAGGPEELPKK
ncbi:gamma-glutamyltransferase [Planococcus lenghuensis]|uniref:Glutathione hydrolase proenzyme n=1 Tax=Planococcus lenghuensis TaxID=2213202 RepID=A0A1Q2L4P1_9BACL|nr:gamma-glutamyltransferase [Planococcus lenghuensis]AQQ54842.1 gamma-glutamyltransferase [Planococcus lenghuensis]